MKLITKMFNLTKASLSKQILARGKSFEISQLFINCKANATFSLYIIERTGRRAASDAAVNNTYYIYKDLRLYAGTQYNNLLGNYDAANREWVEQSSHPVLKFEFDVMCDLYAEIDTTGAEVDIIFNKYEGRRKTTKNNNYGNTR
tara:strand:- start:392 stop:826 length:435 start_codon:yes stop_codon:yes gene_type:complete